MLAGLIILGEVDGGSYRISELDQLRRRRPPRRRGAPRPGAGRRRPRAPRRPEQVRPDPVPLLAARRHGRADPGQRLPARRRHGQGRRLPRRAVRPRLRRPADLAVDGARRSGWAPARGRRTGRCASTTSSSSSPSAPSPSSGLIIVLVGYGTAAVALGRPGPARRARAVQGRACSSSSASSTGPWAPVTCASSPGWAGACPCSPGPPRWPPPRWPACRRSPATSPRRGPWRAWPTGGDLAGLGGARRRRGRLGAHRRLRAALLVGRVRRTSPGVDVAGGRSAPPGSSWPRPSRSPVLSLAVGLTPALSQRALRPLRRDATPASRGT